MATARTVSSSPSGASCAHQVTIDGWWPSSSTIARAWRAACLRTPRVAAFHREVLPQQEARLVGRVVQRGRGDVRVHAEEVEVSTDRALDVGAYELVVGLPEQGARGRVARPLQEHALAVDEQTRSLAADVTERDAPGEAVARHAVDLDVEIDGAQWLRTERARPPTGRIVDGEHPRELVRPGGERRGAERVEQHDVTGTAYDGMEMCLARFAGRVQRDVARDAAAFDRRVDAQHARDRCEPDRSTRAGRRARCRRG